MNYKKLALMALVLVVMCTMVFAGGKAQSGLTLKPGVLTVGMEIGYPPMEYMDDNGKPTGFDVKMAAALAAKLGLKLELVDTAWDGIFAGVDTGKYDCIMSSVTVTEARQAAHNFTKPYIVNQQAMVLLKGSKVRARSPEQLTGLSVAYQEETTTDYYLTGLAEKGLKFTPYEYAKVMSCFDELKLGRVDAVVCDSLVALDYIAGSNSPFEMVWQGAAGEIFGICLKKGNNALTQALDQALDALFADGTMKKLSQEIFNMDLVSASR